MDLSIWKACAGGSPFVPAVGSTVYYFPLGHAEQAVSPPDFRLHRPLVLARVISVQLLADRDTDEVFARMQLRPAADSVVAGVADDNGGGDGGDGDGGAKVTAFAKRLTPSDANNGGGFSVPRFCADAIFPALDYGKEPPAQNIAVKDIHGVAWTFRHIYRGTPRRHLLTTGWSKFVNQKKLVSGDSVVFVRPAAGSISVGIRRGTRPGEVSWRSGRGRLSPESVADAAELAAKGMEFEVVHYPKAGRAEFVVPARAVEASAMSQWVVGARLKMAVETDDAARVAYFHGSIEAIVNSPWRMLQVKWDENEALQQPQRVNPWEIELSSDFVHSEAAKKMRLSLDKGYELSPGGDLFFQRMKLPCFDHTYFPAGMQGARHSPLWASSYSYLPSFKSKSSIHQPHDAAEKEPENMPNSEIDRAVHTELQVGCESQSNSPPLEVEGEDHASSDSLVKSNRVSFKLFGQRIEIII